MLERTISFQDELEVVAMSEFFSVLIVPHLSLLPHRHYFQRFTSEANAPPSVSKIESFDFFARPDSLWRT